MTDKIKINKRIEEELDLICKKNHGLIQPEKVVQFAKDTNTALHSKFEWDNSKAGHNYRLWQARVVIKAYVIPIEKEEQQIYIPKFVSLSIDRGKNGYREITKVLTTKDLKLELMKDAKKEIEYFRNKYNKLTKIDNLFEKAEKTLEMDILRLEKSKK